MSSLESSHKRFHEKWQDGELDLDELKEDLWKYGGVKFREGQINGK